MKVKVFLDQQIEPIVDLPEYKQNLQQINNIIEEIETAQDNLPDNSNNADQIN